MYITAQGKKGIQVWPPRALPTTDMALFQMKIVEIVCKLTPWKKNLILFSFCREDIAFVIASRKKYMPLMLKYDFYNSI